MQRPCHRFSVIACESVLLSEPGLPARNMLPTSSNEVLVRSVLSPLERTRRDKRALTSQKNDIEYIRASAKYTRTGRSRLQWRFAKWALRLAILRHRKKSPAYLPRQEAATVSSEEEGSLETARPIRETSLVLSSLVAESDN